MSEQSTTATTTTAPAAAGALLHTPPVLAVFENSLRAVGRGGRLALISRPSDELSDAYITEVRFTINYLRNDGLDTWPLEAEDRARERYELVVVEARDGRAATLPSGLQGRVVFSTPPTMWVQENDRAMEAPGGRIVLVADNATDERREELEDLGVSAVTALVNYRRNAPMEAWPLAAADRERRRFQAFVLRQD